MSNPAKRVDLVMVATVAILFGIGILMIFSASSAYAYNNYADPYFVIKKQLQWGVIGLVALILAARVRIEFIKRITPLLMVISLILLVAVVAGLGVEVNGATAWIDLKIGRFQPSELAKIVLVLFVARTLSTNIDSIKSFSRGIMPTLSVLAVVAALIMAEPDMGTLLIIGGTIFVMLIVAGARLDHLGLMAGVGGLLSFLYVFNSDLRWKRVEVFLNPWSDPNGKGFQPIQSLLALGSGGINGVGLGNSSQKFLHLPEQHTDFIFAILGEELGFMGAVTVLMLFVAFAWRGYRTALKSQDMYLSFVAAGLTTMIILQAMVNIAVVIGLFPVTGVPLPFISYGGTSLLFSMLGVGILLNVTREVSAQAVSK